MGEYWVFVGKVYAIRSKSYFDLIAALLLGGAFFFLLKHKAEIKSDLVDDIISIIVQIQAALLGFSISLYAIFTTVFNGKESPGNVDTNFRYKNKTIKLYEWFSLVFLKILALESFFVIANIGLMIVDFGGDCEIAKPTISIFTLIYVLLVNFKVMIQKYIITNSKLKQEGT